MKESMKKTMLVKDKTLEELIKEYRWYVEECSFRQADAILDLIKLLQPPKRAKYG